MVFKFYKNGKRPLSVQIKWRRTTTIYIKTHKEKNKQAYKSNVGYHLRKGHTTTKKSKDNYLINNRNVFWEGIDRKKLKIHYELDPVGEQFRPRSLPVALCTSTMMKVLVLFFLHTFAERNDGTEFQEKPDLDTGPD